MQKLVTVSPGQSKQVTFTISPNVAGSYGVSLDGLSKSFNVISPVVVGRMYGRVRADSTPIVGRYVYIGGYRSTEVTNSTGYFMVEGMPVGYYYSLGVEGYELYTLAVELKAGETKGLGTITLIPLAGPPPVSGALDVYVTDAETSYPVNDLLVTLDSIGRYTNANGYCMFGNLVEGTYWMSVTDPLGRYEPKPSVVPGGIPIPATERLDIQLTPLPPGPPPIPEPFEPTFVPLTCARLPVVGGTHEITAVIESLYENTAMFGAFATDIADIAASYIAQYKPTAVALAPYNVGPLYYYKWDDPEGGDTVHGYSLFGREFEGRVHYLPTLQSGIKMIVPALQGKSWTCYLDVNGPYTISSEWFINCLTVTGSGSLIRFRGPAWRGIHGFQNLPTAGRIASLRIEFGGERWVVPCILFLGSTYMGDGMNFDWCIADSLTENKLDHFKYDQCKSKLIEVFNKYNGSTANNYYRPDIEDMEEASYILLGREGVIYKDNNFCWRFNYTVSEVNEVHTNKSSLADTVYAERKAFYEGLKAKYEQNWTDP